MWTGTRRKLAFVARVAALVSVPLLAPGPAIAVHEVSTRVTCQTQAGPGTMLNVDIRLTNEQCVARAVRLISAVVGNTDQMLDGLAVFGPVLVGDAISIPAASVEGCPLGLSIAAARGSDARLLALARRLAPEIVAVD